MPARLAIQFMLTYPFPCFEPFRALVRAGRPRPNMSAPHSTAPAARLSWWDGAAEGVSDHYIILDGFTRLPTSDAARGIYAWNLQFQGTASGRGDFHAGVADAPTRVIDTHLDIATLPPPKTLYYLNPPVLGAVDPALPLLAHGDRGPPPPADLLDSVHSAWGQAPSRVIGVELQALGQQAYKAKSGLQHHYYFQTDWLPGIPEPYDPAANIDVFRRVRLMAFPDDARFTPATPVSLLTNVALRFSSLDTPIVFPSDRVTALFFEIVLTGGVLELQFQTPAPLQYAAALPATFLGTGDRIYIRDFTFLPGVVPVAARGYAERIRRYLTRPEGLVIQQDLTHVGNSEFSFMPTIDAGPLGLAAGTQLAGTTELLVSRNRIVAFLRARCLQRPTNTIVPV